jgi:hypothetical protein
MAKTGSSMAITPSQFGSASQAAVKASSQRLCHENFGAFLPPLRNLAMIMMASSQR